MAEEPEKETRKKGRHIRVPVLVKEGQQIDANAKKAGKKSATYLRELGLGYEVRGIVDYEQVEEMAKISADLGRLGGLLKMWLANDERLDQFSDAQMSQTIRAVLSRIEGNQEELRLIMQTVLRQPR